MYKQLYNSICERNKINITKYRKHSGLHEHHIIPKHSGGTNDPLNLTYVTPRVHIALHFLLWKIYKNPNDLRSMRMLGAKLTVDQRRVEGEFCRDNKIGIFNEKYRNDFCANSYRTKKSSLTCKERGVGIFNQEMKSQWASEAGKIGGRIQVENNLGIHGHPDRRKWAAQGGKALSGYKMMRKGDHKTRIHPSKVEQYLNEGYIMGWKLKET